jgi:hypothetical protein
MRYEKHDSEKMSVFWVVVLCSVAEVYQHFRGPCCLYHQGVESIIALMMEASSYL